MDDLHDVLLLIGVLLGGLLVGYGLGARHWVSGVLGVVLLLAWLFADFLARLADSTDISIF